MGGLLERVGLKVLHCLDPETAHELALRALALGLGPKGGPVTSPRLRTRVAGLDLPNPVGLAAGFDKNAVAVRAALMAGPGFMEVGAVTPRPQAGNPRPRLFRLPDERAIINRLGFNNEGMEAVGRRLRMARRAGFPAPVGINLGANRDSEDRAGDYVAVLRHLWEEADFFTVNVSSPNTERLRELQGRAALTALLERVLEARAALGGGKPVFLKIAPDLGDDEIADIAEVVLLLGVDGVVATNTTVTRPGLSGPPAAEPGGLSGAPLAPLAERVLTEMRRATGGRVPLIGVGGIAGAGDAYRRIRLGASAVELYTALVFGGIGLAAEIARGLDALLARDGFASVSEAVGVDTPV